MLSTANDTAIPAKVRRGKDGYEKMEYMLDDAFHRDEAEGPAIINRDLATGVVTREIYFCNGREHRLNGPAKIERNETGRIVLMYWCRGRRNSGRSSRRTGMDAF
jgi:hypothetical protein